MQPFGKPLKTAKIEKRPWQQELNRSCYNTERRHTRQHQYHPQNCSLIEQFKVHVNYRSYKSAMLSTDRDKPAKKRVKNNNITSSMQMPNDTRNQVIFKLGTVCLYTKLGRTS